MRSVFTMLWDVSPMYHLVPDVYKSYDLVMSSVRKNAVECMYY